MVHSPLILQGGQLQKNSSSTPEVCKHTYTVSQAPSFPFSQNNTHTHTHIHIYADSEPWYAPSLVVSHARTYTQPVKFQLSSAFNALALSPLSPSFLFSLCFPICCAYLCVPSSCMFFPPFYQNLPFQPSKSQSACLCWIIIKQLQWVFRGALREWCNRDTTKRPLCYPRWAEVVSLKRPDLELVTLWQY